MLVGSGLLEESWGRALGATSVPLALVLRVWRPAFCWHGLPQTFWLGSQFAVGGLALEAAGGQFYKADVVWHRIFFSVCFQFLFF